MKKSTITTGILVGFSMLAIIFDGKTAQSSVQQGLEICWQTVIPALFPFLILSGMLNTTLLGSQFFLFRHMGAFCKMPLGSESVLAIGLMSGYPVGAQLVFQAYHDGQINAINAKRLLGFCSNAGPAFIFGMLAPLFDNPAVCWVLWGIHIAGAVVAGHLLPCDEHSVCQIPAKKTYKLSDSLQQAVRTMATICGWVILFRLLFGFLNRWILWLFPDVIQVFIGGILELSNGCILLLTLHSAGLRFILASFMLSIGGICVLMQTVTLTQGLGIGYYFPGKLMQASFSLILSYLLQYVLFPQEQIVTIPPIVFIILVAATTVLIFAMNKKRCSISGKNVV